MNITKENAEQMSAKDVFAAVHNLKTKLEENFVSLGQLFSMIKRKKMFQAKGYENFKDFVEAEYNINSTLANKLCSVYEVYVDELDIDDTTIKELGFDRLNMIKPFVAKAEWTEIEEWMEKAEKMPVNELKEHIKQLKNKEKEKDKDLKEVLIEQYLEKMRTWFNCSQKELNFKLALYFQDADLEEVKKIVKQKQRLFETELQPPKEE
ncbi:MAG: hypothetical protein FJ041_00110 [Candidatus Cloacimonetes bacterium]|nr:hypothetical protein [Candidatus Cloacimonadota bacterium]